MKGSLSATLVPGVPASQEVVEAIERLEEELSHQTTLREAADRAAARARDDREDAFERLVVRCASLEDEAARWADADRRDTADLRRIEREHSEMLARRSDELSLSFKQQLEDVERGNRESIERLERQAAELRDELAAREGEGIRSLAERDASIADRDRALAAAGEREGSLHLELAEAEERFRAEAFHLSALIALRSKEALTAQAEVEALKLHLAAVYASGTWKIGRPLRGAGRLARRLRRVPFRLIGVVRRQP